MLNALIALSLAATAAAPALSDASARSGRSAPVARVSHSDLDLARPADRRTLDRRLGAAVERVCPPASATGQLTRSTAGLRCRADTTARVKLQRTNAVARATASTVTADSR
jgi:UrcA family protein